MYSSKKVSIVLPCYNGKNTITRALYGVINQTYRPIELIFVNDGSIDETMEIVNQIAIEIQKAGIEFKCISQPNLGLGGAINTGLKHITGEFMAWIDADDELMPLSVEKRVKYLEEHPDIGSVSSNAYIAVDSDWDHPIDVLSHQTGDNMDPYQFEYLLIGRSIFCAGCHLVRTRVFEKANNGFDIYPAPHGQNWQMLLPVYYCSKHAFIDEPLYKYRVNADNMSAEIDRMSLKQLYERRSEYIHIVSNTLERIHGITDKERRKYRNKFKKYICELNLTSTVKKHTRKSISYLYWRFKLLYISIIVRFLS